MHVAVKLLNILVLIALSAGLCKAGQGVEAGADWFEEDPDAVFNSINEGQLTFLEKLPQKPVHHHHNTLIVLQDSIETGWVKLVQCHENLDVFPSAQITYNRSKVRNIRLTSHQNIAQVWIEGPTIQLKNVGENARLCLEAESRALWPQADGSLLIQNGPFMRKFLDGYFPMRVSMDIKLPSGLSFVSIEPQEQKGFRVVKGKHGIHFDAWFEGRLVTKIRLQRQPEQ